MPDEDEQLKSFMSMMSTALGTYSTKYNPTLTVGEKTGAPLVTMVKNLGFFSAISSEIAASVTLLAKHNWIFEIEFHTIKAKHPSFQEHEFCLPVNSSTVLKKAVPEDLKPVLVGEMHTFLQGLMSKTDISALGKQSKKLDAEDYDLGGLVSGKQPASPVWKVADAVTVGNHLFTSQESSKNSLPPLKQATKLGEAVKGSGANSMYKVIALGEKLKVAARKAKTTLSVRCEGELTPTIVSALEKLGFMNHQAYLSCHYDLGTIPVERVLGILFFNPDLPFTQTLPVNQISNIEQ